MCMPYNPFSLKGKTIMITGASGGIGSATARECSKLGAKVIITARNKERLESLLDELTEIKDQKKDSFIVCDITDEDAVKNLVTQLPCLDGVVLNAGIGKLSPIKFIKKADFEYLIKVNTISQSLILKELLKKNKLKDGSSVVFTASMAGKDEPRSGNAMYGASKAALIGFSKFAAIELANRKIRVNTICPGMVNTQMNADVNDVEFSENRGVKDYPLGRYGEPEDIAHAFAFLLSDASKWITGIDLIVDGGLHIG